MTLPRRVALVSDWCLPRQGGIETHILALAQNLRRRDVEARIVTTFPGPAEIDGVSVDRIDGPRLPLAPVSLSPGLVGKVRRSLEAGRYDMVHIHCSIVAPLCFAALPAARSLGLPVVVTFHSVMTTMPHFLRVSDPLLGWRDPSVTLTAVSSLVAGQVAGGLRGAIVGTLPNGFDSAFWRPADSVAPASSETRAIRLVSALRLSNRKRPLALVGVMAEALRLSRGTGVDLSLTIAGDGPLRGAVTRRIARLGLSDKIRLAGWQDAQSLRALYAEAALFVMPSRKEAFCIAALEARAAGLPVVAHAATGMADFIRHGETGVLATDDAAMAQAIAALATDRERLARLAKADAGLSLYDWETLTNTHLALYKDCLNGGAAAAQS